MKTKEVYSTGNISYMTACIGDLREKRLSLDRDRKFPIKTFSSFESHFYHQ